MSERGKLTGALHLFFSISENPKSEFANYEQLKQSGLIEKGWLPSFFPASATNIVEGHNIDSNRVWAAFTYDAGQPLKLESICKLIAQSENGRSFICPPFDAQLSSFVLRNDGTGYFQAHPNEI